MPVATLDDVPHDVAVNYSARDADATLRVFPILSHQIDVMGLRDVYRMDIAVLPMVARMMQVGMLIDTGHFETLGGFLSDMMRLKVEELNAITKGKSGLDFNPNSTKQTSELLFGDSGVGATSRKKTKTGKDSTNNKVLEAISFKFPAARIICDYRELAKLRDSFCVTLPKFMDATGRIHPNIKPTRVASGRFACNDPNLLAIPVRTDLGKLIRQGFIAGIGRVLGSWDLDQIEMREMAHQSEDETMCRIFREGKVDIHRQTAAWMFGKDPRDVTSIERYAGKRIGFGVITGITEVGLEEQMALAGAEGWDQTRCAQAIKEWFRIYSGVKSYIADCRAEARRYSYVRDRWGRIRYLPGVHSELAWVREEALRQSHSHKISASAQGIMKHAMAAIWKWWKEDRIVGYRDEIGKIEPLLQIHDELVIELDGDKDSIVYVDAGMVYFLCNTTQLRVPIKAKGSTAHDWGSLKY